MLSRVTAATLVRWPPVNERYQQNSHKWLTWPPLTVGLPVTSERYWAVPRLFHNATVSQCDNFLLLHMYMYLLFEASPGWLPGWRGFFFYLNFWWEALSSNVFTICAVYWSLGRRGYFGVSNVVLVYFQMGVNSFTVNVMSKENGREGRYHYLKLWLHPGLCFNIKTVLIM